MAVTETIQEILQGIDTSQYGRDMRQYIHKGIQKCYEEGSAGETDLTARNNIASLGNSFCTVETGTAISRYYKQNEYFLNNNTLYRVDVDQSSGTSISYGINNGYFVETSIADESKERAINVDFNPSVSRMAASGRIIVVPLIRLVNISFDIIPSSAVSAGTQLIQNLPHGFVYTTPVTTLINLSSGNHSWARYVGGTSPYIECGALSTNEYVGSMSFYIEKYNENHPLSSWGRG